MMRGKSDSPLRADARENRARILAAAQARFASEGVAAEMDTIARDAGVAVGTLYRHFQTKEMLLAAVLRAGFAGMKGFLIQLKQESNPWKAVEELIRYLADRQASDQGFRELLASKPELHSTVIALKREVAPLMNAIVRRAQEAGELRQDVQVSDLPLLLAALPVVTHSAATRERILSILLGGLRETSDVGRRER